MNVILYLLLISFIFFFFYGIQLLYIIYALIQNLFLFEEFIKYILLIGSFSSFFFSLNIKFFNKNKTKTFDNIKVKVNIPYIIISIILVTIMNLAFIFGIYMDIYNVGFTNPLELDFFFVIVQSSIGLYMGNIIGDLFELVNELDTD